MISRQFLWSHRKIKDAVFFFHAESKYELGARGSRL
jgi:hypothetical protein